MFGSAAQITAWSRSPPSSRARTSTCPLPSLWSHWGFAASSAGSKRARPRRAARAPAVVRRRRVVVGERRDAPARVQRELSQISPRQRQAGHGARVARLWFLVRERCPLRARGRAGRERASASDAARRREGHRVSLDKERCCAVFGSALSLRRMRAAQSGRFRARRYRSAATRLGFAGDAVCLICRALDPRPEDQTTESPTSPSPG